MSIDTGDSSLSICNGGDGVGDCIDLGCGEVLGDDGDCVHVTGGLVECVPSSSRPLQKLDVVLWCAWVAGPPI